MALTIAKKMPASNLKGLKMRLVTITFDAAYDEGVGYTLTAAQCGLRKILKGPHMSIPGYQISSVLSGTGCVLKAWKGNTEASDNEAGLNGLVGVAEVWGY